MILIQCQFVLTLLFTLLPLLRARSPQSLAIVRARDECTRSGRLTAEQRRTLDRLEYANELWVQRYLHCFWTQLQLWEDNDGFNSMRIVQTYGGPHRFNVEQALPAIGGCNARARRTSTGNAIDWCYKAFVCILRTPVGDWYRHYMLDVINGNA
ncbi:uncharacterized protein LOC117578225 isoform X2 [Drosophila albomicans]|uniref:Uncharacterized protein LOC117578225 isoform X2 n=1 Tax=Drosophila albomicans TaxID=7291 RepID=A0A6P8Y153_DROAB|nr:uncharacterized protein LOC117578225 isoform X2 [Drosophila albomicans]